MKERAIKRTLSLRQASVDNAKRTAEQRLEQALAIPEIASAHTALVDTRFASMLGGAANNEKLTAARSAYLSALNKYGFSEDDFEYTPLCPICKDSGNNNGKVCKCVWEEYVKQLAIECRIAEKAPFTFDDCNTAIAKDDEQRKNLNSLYAFMRKYADKLPDVNIRTIVLSGSVGTGKTCIASAVANAVVKRGMSCKYVSAYEFGSEMLSCHTSPIAERADRLHDVLTADLLVIDDLGTEPILKNVTIEYLLLTLEERLNAGLCTIITTNLDESRIMSRYFERIYSRLSDKLHSRFIRLGGNDLRQG